MSYVTPWSGPLEEGMYRITMPASVTVGADIYNFSQWEDGSTDPMRTINLVADMIITATYVLAPPPPQRTLTISVTPGGTTNPSPASWIYDENTIVTVTAIPDANYRFVNWELDGVIRTENPINVTMDKDYSLHAVFEYVAPPPKKATIRGFIRDAKTATPIVGATVTCDGYTDITKADGAYEFIDVPAASYTLTVTMEGYQTETVGVDASAGGTFPIDLELTLTPPPPRCFIATVAYGSPLASELNVLRWFRDSYLPTKIVNIYYAIGPHLAQQIKGHALIKRYVREVFSVLVKMLEGAK